MAIKSKFFRRACTSKQRGAAATQIVHEWSAQEEVREEQQVMGSGDHGNETRSGTMRNSDYHYFQQEARDESNPFNDFSIAVGTVILSYACLLGSTIERTANEAIFPHGVDDTGSACTQKIKNCRNK
jgi:hypothetical protein